MIPAEILNALVAAATDMNDCDRDLKDSRERLHREQQCVAADMRRMDAAGSKFSECLDAFMKACK